MNIMLINIGENEFVVRMAVSKKQRMMGMMRKRFDDSFNGMLFMDVGGGRHCFWMKNCIIPLDIIFINNKTIVKIHHDCPPCETDDCESYCGDGDMVLEIAGGRCRELGIQEGDTLSFTI